MRLAPNGDKNLLVGSGILYVEPFDVNGIGLGLRDWGEVDKFSISFNPTILTKYSSRTKAKGLVAEIALRASPILKITSSDWVEETVREHTYGTLARLVQAATPVVSEPIVTSLIVGNEYFYKTLKLGPITAVTVTFNATPGVLGTDYVITRADVGLIRILPTTILTGPVTISYTPTAYTSTNGPSVIAGGASLINKARFVWISDATNGPNRMVEVWKASLRPDAEEDFVSDDFGNMQFQASVYDDSPNHPTNPFYNDTWLT
jgi:hypothetical protein